MRDDQATEIDRREFLRAGALAGAATLAAAGPGRAQDDKAAPGAGLVPKRKLGKAGPEVSILNQGTWQSPALDRLLRFAFASGVRYYDTAKSYGSEPGFKRWFRAQPEVRDQIFLVTKDSPREPGQLVAMLDQRLDALGTDRVDLFFVHALGDRDPQAGVDWPKSVEFGRAIETIKNSGKAKLVGFSSHHQDRAKFLESAAIGGFVDAIMLQYNPWIDKDSPLNKALDACHAKGIGLISMKQVAGQFGGSGDGSTKNVLEETVRRVPMLKEKGLSPYQGLLHAIWTDERISSACVSMRNTDQIRENSDAARRFEPLKLGELRQLRDAALAHGPTLCADCDGRCSRAAGTAAALGDLTRLMTYHDFHGDRGEARRQYAELAAAARDWAGADLAAARAACPNGLDFAKLLPRVDRYLA